jgi:hypothetical protein
MPLYFNIFYYLICIPLMSSRVGAAVAVKGMRVSTRVTHVDIAYTQ